MNTGKLNDWLGVATNIGIIVGLVYVGLEYQQNNDLIRIEADANSDSQINSIIDIVIQDGDLVKIMGKEKGELTVAESDRLRLLGVRMLLAMERTYRNAKDRGPSEIDRIRDIQRSIYRRPRLNYGIPLAWPTYRDRTASDYVTWFAENVIAE